MTVSEGKARHAVDGSAITIGVSKVKRFEVKLKPEHGQRDIARKKSFHVKAFCC